MCVFKHADGKDMKKKKLQPYTLISNIRYIYHILFEEVRIMPVLLIISILIGIVLPIMNTLISTVAVACITKGDSVLYFVIAMIAVLMVNGILVVSSRYIGSWSDFYLSHVQSKNFLMGLVKKSLTADYDHIEPQKQQALLNGASHAVHVYRQGVHLMYAAVPTLISCVIGIILYSATITILDIRILIVIIIMNIVGVLLNMRAQKINQSFNEEQYALWGRIFYLKRQTMSIASGKDIRIYNMRKWFSDAFQKQTDRNVEMGICKNKAWGLSSLVDIVFSLGRDLLAYGLLIIQVLNGSLNLAEFTFGLGIVAGFSRWIEQLRWGWSDLANGNIMLIEYRKMMDYPDCFLRQEGLSKEDIGEAFENNTLGIEFQNVSFRYDEEGPYILKDINITIKPGEKIALVGHNGAGKTTLIKLLCGLYHPSEGQILVGGYNIENYNLEEYQKLLATIFQDVNIIPLSIASNVSGMKLEDTDMEKVKKCLIKAGLWDKTQELEKKEYTYLGQEFAEDGIKFSGGMVQKLMIARAMYKEAPILILDEPTAALDPIAESNLYQEYSSIAKEKTSIFISHRLASTRFCDRIIYLEDGMVTETGTHEELINLGGKYAYVFQVQSQYYQEEQA